MNSTVILAVVCGLLSFWLVVLTALIASEKQFLKNLAKGVVKKDLISILKQLNQSLKQASNQLESSSDRLNLLETKIKSHLQKVGFVRFNPFSETGGDQSFCLCLLDQENNGIVITSLHARTSTRLYAKQVIDSAINKAEYSDEEWQAYQAAKKMNN